MAKYREELAKKLMKELPSITDREKYDEQIRAIGGELVAFSEGPSEASKLIAEAASLAVIHIVRTVAEDEMLSNSELELRVAHVIASTMKILLSAWQEGGIIMPTPAAVGRLERVKSKKGNVKYFNNLKGGR